ncbi:DMT family transporter [Roseicitreum antarcticum]|uniref:EamA-like transporter family protein n=1 Tax=Roseicitreum antarcticum TaxID=564137 RepID=A0A1H2XQD1_9RHOB|nr:DMT family transporter [Roseicitreum antarcticum]SDW95025.1 EamA-like transporter family protein [Roseicitreum antarcticum]
MSNAPPPPGPARNNLRGAGWLLADMALNIWALTIVKAMGADFSAAQIVFIRAAVGLVLLIPFVARAVYRARAQALQGADDPDDGKAAGTGGAGTDRGTGAAMRLGGAVGTGAGAGVGTGRALGLTGAQGALRLRQPWLHLLRVMLSTVALTSSFFAVAKVPLALFTAINFTRPVVMMVMAALILREVIRPTHWLAGAVGLVGVLIAVQPAGMVANPGVLALFVTVFAGTGAIIVTRKMRAEPPLIMMLTYTAGLALFTLPLALWFWVPLGDGWRVLIWVGVFSQAAQFCFLRAHFWGEAGVLGPLSYASLVLSTLVGYLVFDEVPTPAMALGAGLIVLATLSISGLPRKIWPRKFWPHKI